MVDCITPIFQKWKVCLPRKSTFEILNYAWTEAPASDSDEKYVVTYPYA